jgi:nucleoside-diphosphate-sugar epimerase
LSKVLLTGASGFLGRHMLQALRQSGAELHAASRTARAMPGVTWHAADLRDPRAAAELVHAIGPTHILHSAWDVTPGRFWSDPQNADWATAGIALAEAAAASGARFVGVGTCAEYAWSDSEPVLAEDRTPIRPATLYGQSKARVWEAAARHPDAAWGRIFLPYGPGDNAARLLPSVLAALRAGQPVDLTSGVQERDFVYAPDIGEFFVRLLFSPQTGAFNVGTGTPLSIRAAVEQLADRLGASAALLRFGGRPDNGEPQTLVADMRKSQPIWAGPPKSFAAGLSLLLGTL